MRNADFLSELQRLFRASKCEGDLTPERIAVWWEKYQHEPLPRWKRAASLAIGDPGRPSMSRMDSALQRAEDEEAQAKIARDRGTNTNPMRSALTKNPLPDAFLALQRRVSEMIESGEKPPAVADYVEQWAHTDPDTDYSDWIRAMRFSPQWNNMPLSAKDGGPLIRDLRLMEAR